MKRQIVTITPELARALLDRTKPRSRGLSYAHVERIARQIVDGKWRFTGDTIKIDKDGTVIDGQHRLQAVIQAGTAVEMTVIQQDDDRDVPLAERGFGTLDERNNHDDGE